MATKKTTTKKVKTKKENSLEKAMEMLINTQVSVINSQKETNEKLDKMISLLENGTISDNKKLNKSFDDIQKEMIVKQAKTKYTVYGKGGLDANGKPSIDLSTSDIFYNKEEAEAFGKKRYGVDRYYISQTIIPQ